MKRQPQQLVDTLALTSVTTDFSVKLDTRIYNTTWFQQFNHNYV